MNRYTHSLRERSVLVDNEEKIVHSTKETIKKVETYAGEANMALTEMRIQFETLAEMQKEERIQTQKMHNEEKDSMRKHYFKVIIGLIATLIILIGGIIGGIMYFLSNYDLRIEYGQDLYVGGNGDQNIHDGIHVNTD